jgi:hypothetical protein
MTLLSTFFVLAGAVRKQFGDPDDYRYTSPTIPVIVSPMTIAASEHRTCQNRHCQAAFFVVS